ncbi:MAG: glycosyl hydrolase family 18 protein [Fibrobacterales bacterium]
MKHPFYHLCISVCIGIIFGCTDVAVSPDPDYASTEEQSESADDYTDESTGVPAEYSHDDSVDPMESSDSDEDAESSEVEEDKQAEESSEPAITSSITSSINPFDSSSDGDTKQGDSSSATEEQLSSDVTPSSAEGNTSGTISQGDFKNVGYLTTWADFNDMVTRTDFTKFTHMIVAFAYTDAAGNVLVDITQEQMSALVTKAHNAHCRVLISIGGGAADANVWLSVLSDVNRASTISKLIKFIELHNLDGIDVDLEGSLVTSDIYNPFVNALAAALPEEQDLSAAVGFYNANSITDKNLDNYDFINTMTYDYRGPWRPEEPGQHSPYEFALSDLEYWKGRGLPASKIILGVPFYGWNFDEAGVPSWTYKDIVLTYPGAEDTDAIGQLYYNGQPTIKAKTELALQEAGGIMNWDMAQDIEYSDGRSLLRTIVETIEGNMEGNMEENQ